MLYFKHYATMRNDTKIRKLTYRYGLEGYGLYNVIIESITEEICDESPMPELKENCADIAELYHGNTERINEMVAYMINIGLLELSEVTSKIQCHKIYKYLEKSITRSPRVRQLVDNYKKNVQFVPDNPGLLRTNLIEEEVEEEQEIEKEVEPEKQASESLFDYMIVNFQKKYEEEYKTPFMLISNERAYLKELITLVKDKETFDSLLTILLNNNKLNKDKKYNIKVTPKGMVNNINKLNEILAKERRAQEKPLIPRYKSGRPKIRGTMSLRHSILQYPDYANSYELADVWEDDIQHGHRDAGGKWLLPDEDFERWKLSCYDEKKD